MKAAVEENRAKVMLAEAEVPLALAHAFRSGHLGVMDYFNMRNVQADTEMRNSIAGTTGTVPGAASARNERAPIQTQN
jgi:uncharacterized protein YqfA (UPF0365 family)